MLTGRLPFPSRVAAGIDDHAAHGPAEVRWPTCGPTSPGRTTPIGDGQSARARGAPPVSERPPSSLATWYEPSSRCETAFQPPSISLGCADGCSGDPCGTFRDADTAQLPDGLGRRPLSQASAPATAPPTGATLACRSPAVIAVLLVVSAALFQPILSRTKEPLGADTTTHHPARETPSRRQTPTSPGHKPCRPAQRSVRLSVWFRNAPRPPTIDIEKELSNAEAESKRDDEGSARSALHRIDDDRGSAGRRQGYCPRGDGQVARLAYTQGRNKSLCRAEQCQGPRFGNSLPGQSGRPTPWLLIIPRIRSCQFPTPPPPR